MCFLAAWPIRVPTLSTQAFIAPIVFDVFPHLVARGLANPGHRNLYKTNGFRCGSLTRWPLGLPALDTRSLIKPMVFDVFLPLAGTWDC